MEEQDEPRIENPRAALKPFGGRDELNLAEFPITLLSDRVPKGCKTLQFEIEPRDNRSGKPVARKLTVTGSDAFGLPTAIDDEVLVALIQLTKLKNGFSSPTVYYSRYEIVKLLGWPDDGRSYRRIEESIKRWTGVTLYYDNAWYNKESEKWASESFHVIERSSIIDEETKRQKRQEGQHELAFSFFKWNEIIFQSFQAGTLKRLDIDAYFSFKTSVAKRMYRYLDKKFWVKPRWEFDLKQFAFEHIGLSRKYDVAQIKNKLQPAIDELTSATKEREAFLEAMDPEDRYVKIGKGQWLVRFARKTGPSLPVEIPVIEPKGLEVELVNRGVSPEIASELVRAVDAEHISLRLEVHDWTLQQRNGKLIPENPTAYLISSIRDRYLSVPRGFESKAEREKKLAAKEEANRLAKEQATASRAKELREKNIKERRIDRWNSMSEEELSAFKLRAVSEAGDESRAQYESTTDRRLREMLAEHMARSYLEKLIEAELGGADSASGV